MITITENFIPVFDVDDAAPHSEHLPATTPPGLLSTSLVTELVTMTWTGSMRVMYHNGLGVRTDDTEDPTLNATVTFDAHLEPHELEFIRTIPITGAFGVTSIILPWTSLISSADMTVTLSMTGTPATVLVGNEHWDLDVTNTSLTLTSFDVPDLSAAATGTTAYFSPIG